MTRRRPWRRGAIVLAGALLLAAGGALAARRVYLEAKAAVARVLIGRALDDYLRDGRPRRPWSWADMHPIARLEVPRLRVACPVLSGASGQTLAFGAGHVDGTAPPGRGGSILAGHRDRSFAFLREVEVGDQLRVAIPGEAHHYVVDSIRIVPDSTVDLLPPDGADRLALVTCWPFDGITRSSLRYVVTAAAAPGR